MASWKDYVVKSGLGMEFSDKPQVKSAQMYGLDPSLSTALLQQQQMHNLIASWLFRKKLAEKKKKDQTEKDAGALSGWWDRITGKTPVTTIKLRTKRPLPKKRQKALGTEVAHRIQSAIAAKEIADAWRAEHGDEPFLSEDELYSMLLDNKI